MSGRRGRRRWPGLVRAAVGILLAAAALTAGTASAQRSSGNRPAPGGGEQRVALIVGNANYAIGRLNNPVLDARAMTQTLRALGFEVLAHENLNYQSMRRAVAGFGERIAGGGVALFYYSGHGLQVNGKNYLVPIDAEIKSEAYVSAEAVDVDSVLAQMQDAKTRVNVVILDACRDNPLARRFRGVTRGLAFMDAPTGTYVAYATAPGSVAEDGEPGKNGVYTGELVKVLRNPGLRIEDVFKRVRVGVQGQTKGRQNPWDASSLTGDFYFNLRTAALAPTPAPPKVEIREEVRQEVGTLALSAKIEGVEVFLGDQQVGETKAGRNLVMENLAVGTYRVKARRQGYKDWEREVQVLANQRAELVIDIDPFGPAKVVKGEDGAEMVLVPAGEFWMGSDEDDEERPRRRVYLEAFHIDKYEVTNGLYKRFMEATGRQAQAYWNDEKWNGASQPVVAVSWLDAYAYCFWAGKRLPTEAEWEKAARGTDGRKYPWGDQWDVSRANSTESQNAKTVAVGSYPGGVSPYGAHDMAGNVLEWVADWYDRAYYQRSPERNPSGPESGQFRVLRGGSWRSNPIFLRSAFRGSNTPDNRFNFIGFRCAKGAAK